ncbi:nitrate assimilation regulatory protein nirA [Purpureocillium lilacinum]|uniref:Nitrate assimilation regulatory protein nirA n=1 Tax=Purpureocillium lilacinum TaxID=33203 RepID=A0A179FK13_PURLI|nr:nitrate assimilation regulatory protein nirA [Purpureocillium lilacinum]
MAISCHSVGGKSDDNLGVERTGSHTSTTRNYEGVQVWCQTSSVHALKAEDDPSQEPIDRWTRTGWTVTAVRQLLDFVATWDYFPFYLLCRDSFLKDFDHGLERYCSSALVNAFLALASRISNDKPSQLQRQHADKNGDIAGSSDTLGLFGSQNFSEEAEALINKIRLPLSLPDTQAIGILALHRLSCGLETEARELAEAFVNAAGELCLRDRLLREEDTQILKLMTAFSGNSLVDVIADDGIFLNQSPHISGRVGGPALEEIKPGLLSSNASQLDNLQRVQTKLFQLTEWVYKIVVSSQLHTSAAQTSRSQVVAAYIKCLDCMYYQYCLLCLFRIYTDVAFDDTDIQPREICFEAAQSIRGLSQFYNAALDWRRGSPFVPYFVLASGMSDDTGETASSRAAQAGPASIPISHVFSDGADTMIHNPADPATPSAAFQKPQ